MRSISKMIKSVAMASALFIGAAFSANAVVIKQDIIADADSFPFVLGTIEVELLESKIGTGLFDTAFDSGLSLKSLVLLGTTFTPEEIDVAFFEAALDTDNLKAGLEVLFFDIEESGFFDNWTYQVAFDAFNPDFNIIDIFDSNGDLVFFSFEVALGQAEVSAPATIALVTLAMGGLLLRRRA